MKIRKRERVERREPVRFGRGSHGKRKLVQAVMNAGYPKRLAEKAVEAVIKTWKAALRRRERVEMPLGYLKARRTPARLRNKRYATRQIGNRKLDLLCTWTVYNDEFRILWRVPPAEWAELINELNPGLPPEVVQNVPADDPKTVPIAGVSVLQPQLAITSFARQRPHVPSRTPFRKRT